MHIDRLLAEIAERVPQGKTLTISSCWTQGRTVFGGLSAALLSDAMQTLVSDSQRLLRSLSTSFVGPLLADMPFSIELELLRTGNNASHINARIVQAGQVAVTQQASFALPRNSRLVVNSQMGHQLSLPERLAILPDVEGLIPRYMQHIDLALAAGGLPYSASQDSHLHGWMRFKQPPRAFSDAHLICLVDAWPPAVIQMMKQRAPASSMTWNLEFVHPQRTVAASDWLAYQAQTRQAADGYAHCEANIWDRDGELLAISRQMVTVFD
ncbi:acyl-CoA thioesterase [Agarivorans sp. QJM3NY_25]|uniref:acyl-CoA thioesterase n=1 Tax=Agarivorans sp. QJM3NY_25 TaxID=3421430 RepID=UPI003D7CDBEA